MMRRGCDGSVTNKTFEKIYHREMTGDESLRPYWMMVKRITSRV